MTDSASSVLTSPPLLTYSNLHFIIEELRNPNAVVRSYFPGCENFCSGDGKIDENGKVDNDFRCKNNDSSIDVFECLPTTSTQL